MFSHKDTNLWGFLETRNFHSTENLNKLSAVLLRDFKAAMFEPKPNYFEPDYDEWLDNLHEVEDDGEDAYFQVNDKEERSFHEYLAEV